MGVAIFDIITFVVSTIWLIESLRKISLGSRYFINVLIYIFYILPLGMDYIYQMADYSYSGWWGFIVPRNDILTVIIYDLGLLYTQYIIVSYKRKRDIGLNRSVAKEGSYTAIMLIGMILPAVAVLVLLRQPGMLYMFQWRELELFSTEGSFSTIERFTFIGVSCSAFLLFDLNRKLFHPLRLIALIFLYVNICIEGKRAIIFFAMINIAVLIYLRFKELKSKGKGVFFYIVVSVPIVAAAIVVMVFMTVTVKMERGYDVNDTSKMYTTTRIDFLRDDRLRLAIYSDINRDEVKLLDYPLQTFFHDVFAFIPLNYIPPLLDLKTYSYQTYFTYALEHKERKTEKLNVQEHSYMTVTCFAEIISNLGFFIGFLLLPFFCLWFSRKIDKYPYPYNAFIICSFILLHLFDFFYVAVYLELTFILCWIYKKTSKKRFYQYENSVNRTVAR